MTEVIKTAIVGAGRIARQHIACLKTIPGVEIAAVCDLSPVRAEYMAETFEVAHAYADVAAMLAEIEPRVVHVTTPPASHFQIAGDALRAGAHVIVEKPICLAYADFVALRELAAEFHAFYTSRDHKVLSDDPGLRDARVTLSLATQRVIRNALELLGVSAPETM